MPWCRSAVQTCRPDVTQWWNRWVEMPFLDGVKLFMFIHSPSVMVFVMSLHPPGVFNSQQDAVQGKSKFDMKTIRKTFCWQFWMERVSLIWKAKLLFYKHFPWMEAIQLPKLFTHNLSKKCFFLWIWMHIICFCWNVNIQETDPREKYCN